MFVLAVVFLLLIFQYAILHLIPVDYTLRYIYLNVNEPTFSSMFLNNYMHNPLDPAHIGDNIPSFVFLVVIGFVLGAVVMPAMGCRMPDGFFFRTYAAMFLLLPFSVSGVSIWSARIMGKVWSSGFSGINFALLGLFIFLMLAWLYRMSFARRGVDRETAPFGLLSATLLVMAITTAFVLFDLKYGRINVCGHLGGFFLGMLVSSLTALYLTAKMPKQKRSVLFLLGLVVLLPAVGWMVV